MTYICFIKIQNMIDAKNKTEVALEFWERKVRLEKAIEIKNRLSSAVAEASKHIDNFDDSEAYQAFDELHELIMSYE